MLAPILTFILFVGGLLAWRLQLLDKRRFEVAEQVTVVYAKVAQAISVLRMRHSWEGFQAVNSKGRRDYYRQMRKWHYAIPEQKLAAFEEVYKELAPTVVLARMYLSAEIAEILAVLALDFETIKESSRELVRIEPEPSIDNEFAGGEPRPDLDEDEDPDGTPSELEMQVTEQTHLPVRFDSLKDDDEMRNRAARDAKQIGELCKPYKSLNPWRFLKRYVMMFFPSQENKI